MRFVFFFLLLIALAVTPCMASKRPSGRVGAPHATSKHVRYVQPGGSDRNDGSRRRPWATVQHAAEKALPGDTIIIRDGIYPETVLITSGGLPSAPITYRAENKWGARIAPLSTPALYTIAIAVGVDHIVIQDLEITGQPETNWGIKVNGNHSRIIGNKLHAIANNDRECIAGAAILVGGDYANNDTEIRDNTIFNIGPPRSAHFRCNKMHGIYLTNQGGVVSGNSIAQVWQGFGIHLYGQVANWKITGNRISDCGDIGHTTGGAYYISCGPNVFHCDNITVADNTFENTQNSCIWHDPGPGTLGPGLVYTNNTARNCSPNYW